MISQVPALTYAVTLGRSRRLATPLGVVSLHHVRPSFFFGYEEAGRAGGRLATPEKALLDFLYLAPTRSRLFRALPELVAKELQGGRRPLGREPDRAGVAPPGRGSEARRAAGDESEKVGGRPSSGAMIGCKLNGRY